MLGWITLRLTTVIMANIKSDEVKQSLDNLEKHHLFTEGELKPVWILTLQDHAGRRNVSFTHTPSINSRRKKQLRNVFKKFFASVIHS